MSHLPPYWCTRRLLVTVEGPQGKSVIPLARPFARIGRQSGSDVVLDSPWVAKRSIYLHATDEGVFCIYMQPEETNTQRMGYWLGPGEELLVGPYRISACLQGDVPGPAPAFAPLDEWGSAEPPYPVFQVYSGGKLRDKRKFRARLNLIGRRHECALQIKGQQVSAFHGLLYWHLSRLWYVDLASSNGSSVNGEAINCGELRVGDQLAIGEFVLHFQRLSQRGGHSPAAESPHHQQAAMLPAAFDDDLPPDLQEDAALALADSRDNDFAGSSPVIALAEEAAATSTGEDDAAAPVPVQQTRQELALLQKRVEELTQLTARTGQTAAQQLAQKTHEAFERERQRIAQELARRGAELAREKQALEAQWHNASRELSTQVNQLRDEATALAQQRLAMEQSRLLWDQQRTELERQLRSYAEQLQRLEQGSGLGLPAPAPAQLPAVLPTEPVHSASESPLALPPAGPANGSHVGGQRGGGNGLLHSPRESMAVVPAVPENGALVARSHVVDAHVGTGNGTPVKMPLFLEGTLAAAVEPRENGQPPDAESKPDEPALIRRQVPESLEIKGRKAAAKPSQSFDAVTDRIVEREHGQHIKMIVLGVAVSVAVVILAVTLLVIAYLWRPT